MARVHGKNSALTLDGVDLSEFLDSVSHTWGADMAETSGLGDSAKSYIPGQRDATLSLSGRFDSTAATGPDAVLGAEVQSDTAVVFAYGPEGSGSGDVRFTGSCYVASYVVSSPVGDVVAFTAELQVTGPVTKDTFPA